MFDPCSIRGSCRSDPNTQFLWRHVAVMNFRSVVSSLICGLMLLAGWRTAAWGQAERFGSRDQLPAKERFHLFLLVGQSNMAGRGKVSDRRPKTGRPRVDAQQRREVGARRRSVAFRQARHRGRGFGPDLRPRNRQGAIPTSRWDSIPCAVGGSPISSWEPGQSLSSRRTAILMMMPSAGPGPH